MTAAALPHRNTITPRLPALDIATLGAVLTAGAFATIAFDLFGQMISPLLSALQPLFGAKLAPVGLANGVIAAVTGLEGKTISSNGLGYGLHVVTGLLAYPTGYLVLRTVANQIAPALPWWALAVGYGVALWVLALFVMAHLVVGMPAFLGFTGITWVALWGHILFALVAAATLRARGF
ncbi:MAG: hypothetical protein AAF675_11210 [Pseudomonadota bacterium]